MININTGFSLGAGVPLDSRTYLTKAEMLAVNENIYPDYLLVTCSEDGFLYMFDKNMDPSEVSATTGKFKLFAGDVEEAINILNGDKDTEGSVLNTVLKNAKDGEYASVKTTIEEIDMGSFSVDNIIITKEQLDEIKATPDVAVEVETGYELTYVSASDSFTITDTSASDTKPVVITESEKIVVTTIHKAIENLAEAAEVELKVLAPSETTEGYLKTYEIKQGDKSVGKIDIPKDLVVSAGSVIEIEEDKDTPGTFNVKGETDKYTSAEVADKDSKFYGYPLAAGTFLKLVIANQLLPVFIDASSLVDTGSLGKITEDITANIELGGYKNGDIIKQGTEITEFVKNLLVKYFGPTITLSGTGDKLVKKGTTIPSITLTATVTKKSEKVTAVEINGNAVTDPVEDGGVFTDTVANVSTTTTFTATATDGKTPASASVTYTFVNPYFYGVLAKDTIETDADLALLTEDLAKKGAKDYKFTANDEYIVIAYDDEYAALTKILDQNGFDNTDSFTAKTYTTDDGTAYKYYISNLKATCTNFGYTFE